MPLQTPPPPSISPSQMNLLRVVAAMAWADGNLAEEEVDVMLDSFSGLFAADAPQKEELRKELRDYVMQNIPLEELIPKLQTIEERELVLRLGYAVINSSARTPDEELVNAEEAEAYQRLVNLLGFAPETVKRVEEEAIADLSQSEGLIERLTRHLGDFIGH
ncbi:TerB family tellurite resistance protein [Thermoleptolyngbya sichuanensis A183]|uniref:TerB family tellurite resistance protein n=2 Tax=Thermoleptolyngbya TaxID=2303528 RepID=A0A6M8BA81_9CYAN|nr:MULTISPECIES: TerB family tellurite resistance protein [Thermoleptolyngbya]MDG2615371.1 TerB family tellurite resistance protein [Thermoleptolyngbya sichuanensis XZ-Cy5]QKD81026.1 TerB family tellurite resistance protein [Thermoleptolyngbya sichuanensis A183]WOB42488.1 TerB family tellurite resistance protein [Thermoleptolyngbya oregonensis NK1-22]